MKTIKEGDVFGDYHFVRRLGKGGMGEVWLLESVSGRQVAAKILDPEKTADHESRRRFVREAQLALGVKHPNLVETYDVGEDPETGICYILMEYVSGGTLADRIRNHGALAIQEAVGVIRAMANVLELGWRKGIVHRDIKPANIMFSADSTPKLADLGIARSGNVGAEMTTITQTGVMIGTPAYMAPEQMLDAHTVDTRADIYSLGVVFFEMLTGERPNKDDTVIQLMARAVKGEPLPDVRTLRPEVSASLAQLLNMMVVPDRDGRISTPGQITNALAIISRGGKFDIAPVSRPVARDVPRQDTRPLQDNSSQRRQPERRFPLKFLIPIGLMSVIVLCFILFAPKRERQPLVVVQTNVVERVVKKDVVITNGVHKHAVEKPSSTSSVSVTERPRYPLKKISTLGIHSQQHFKILAAQRKSGQRRGIMVFGMLCIDGKYSGQDVTSWTMLADNGWFFADVWPRSNEVRRHGRPGGRIVFLKQGYEPVEIDLSKEADREWTDEYALDLGRIKMKPLSRARQYVLSLVPHLPTNVNHGELVLRLRNEKPCGYDWHVFSKRQKPSIDVVKREFTSGERIAIDGCLPADYTVILRAQGCATYKKEIDMTDATARNLRDVTLPRVLTARFAVRPFAGGPWKVTDVKVDNENTLPFFDNPQRHRLSLNPFETPQGLLVSSYYSPATFDDYGEMTTAMFDAQMAKGTLANPIAISSKSGNVNFFPGRIYRLRNSYLPIDAVIAFQQYAENIQEEHTATSQLQDGIDKVKSHIQQEGKKVLSALEDFKKSRSKVRDPDQLKDPNSTRAVQKALDSMFPGWKTSETAKDDKLGYRLSFRGENDVLCSHPPRRGVPVVFSNSIKVTGENPVLHLRLSNHQDLCSFRIRVKINGKYVREKDISLGWTDIYVGLEQWKGQKVKIQLEHLPTGWYKEWAYWSALEILDDAKYLDKARDQEGEKCVKLYDHAKIEGRDQKRAVQKVCDVLFPGWKVSENGLLMATGYEEEFIGRYNNLLTHPPKEGVPVILSRMITIPKGTPKLFLSVANQPDGDFKLLVKVNGNIAFQSDVAEDGWKDYTIDLVPWAGKSVKMELVQMPTGWRQEWAHWNWIEIR